MRRRISFWFKVALSAGLFAWLLRQTDFGLMMELLSRVTGGMLAAVLAVTFLERITMAYRWLLLLRFLGHHPPFGKVFQILLVSNSLGSFSPGGFGVDALRVYGLSGAASEAPVIASTVVADRLLGMLSLVLVSLVSASLALDAFDGMRAVWLALAACLAVILVVIAASSSRYAMGLVGRFERFPIVPKVREMMAGLRVLRRDGRLMLWSLLWAVILQAQRVVVTLLVARSLAIGLPAVYFFLFCPILFFLRQLPISINGIGVSEGLHVWFFGQVGLSTTEAFTLSAGMTILSYFMIAVGGILYLLRGLGSTAPSPAGRPTEREFT